MIHFILIFGLLLLAVAVTMVTRAIMTPAGPSTETIQQIGAYGFTSSLTVSGADESRRSFRSFVDDVTATAGAWMTRHFSRLRGKDYRSRLIAAGMYESTPERLLGTQLLAAIAGCFLAVWLTTLAGGSAALLVLAVVGAGVLGWMLPMYIVGSRARKRRDQVERGLADLIDLLVVTLEAGLSFPQSLRMASLKIKEPLAGEVRLTLQEQNMGLTLVEALDHFNHPGRHDRRADVRAVDLAGRDDGRLDGSDHAQPRRRDAQAPAGLRRGACPEGAGQDPLPDHVPDHAGALHRAIASGDDRDHGSPRLARGIVGMRPVPNLTLRREDGRVVAESVTVADSTLRRLRGLLGKADLPSGHGVLLRPAWSIHTAFMRFPIDVVFLDADQVVVKIVPRLKPFSTASCRGAREVVELRAGECDRRGLSLGDRVAWAARANVDETPVRPGAELVVDRRGSVVLASKDQRYLKLVRFLLDGKGIDVVASVPPAGAADAAGGEAADVVVIDTGDMLTEGLRIANVTRARRPEATVVLVGERAEERSPVGMRVYEKWDETEGVVAAVESALARKAG